MRLPNHGCVSNLGVLETCTNNCQLVAVFNTIITAIYRAMFRVSDNGFSLGDTRRFLNVYTPPNGHYLHLWRFINVLFFFSFFILLLLLYYVYMLAYCWHLANWNGLNWFNQTQFTTILNTFSVQILYYHCMHI